MKLCCLILICLLSITASAFEINCDITKTHTGEILESIRGQEDSKITLDLGYAKLFWSGFNENPESAPVGYYAIIFGDGTFNSTYGHSLNTKYSLIDRGLGKTITCEAHLKSNLIHPLSLLPTHELVFFP